MNKNPRDHTLGNLRTLCSECHKAIHHSPDPPEIRADGQGGEPDEETGEGDVNLLADVIETQKREIQRLREQCADREHVSEARVYLDRLEDELHSETCDRARVESFLEDAQQAIDDALGGNDVETTSPDRAHRPVE
ncbi:hypothetical protein [Natronorarus salvus]|uniref:hypothetical protein n=1 Tax=Natronorarus salvus TaxID=3117733 RepID=UPI002F262044